MSTQINIARFDIASYNRHKQDQKIFDVVEGIILQLLTAAQAPSGDYIVRVVRKVRWQGHHLAPYKINLFEHKAVYVTVKPLDTGNASAFEYTIRGTFPEWDAQYVYELLRNYANSMENPQQTEDDITEMSNTPRQQVVPQPSPKAPAAVVTPSQLSVLERVAQIEETARRNVNRETELGILQQERDALQVKMKEMQRRLSALEEQEMALLETIENDVECRTAMQALAALKAILQ